MHAVTRQRRWSRPGAVMTEGWGLENQGALVLPSGRIVRGRPLRKPVSDGASPDFGLYLLGHEPDPTPWPYRWLRWPDFGLPSDRAGARDALLEVWDGPPTSVSRSHAGVVVVAPAPRWRAWPCSTASRPPELSPMFDSTTTSEQWRHRGSEGTSLGSAGGNGSGGSSEPPAHSSPVTGVDGAVALGQVGLFGLMTSCLTASSARGSVTRGHQVPATRAPPATMMASPVYMGLRENR